MLDGSPQSLQCSMDCFRQLAGSRYIGQVRINFHRVVMYSPAFAPAPTHGTADINTLSERPGLVDRVLTFEEIATLIEANAPRPGPRGPYKR
jgi:hypothetical protein